MALIILAAALLVLYPPSEGGLRRVVPLSIALAGAVSAFSVGAIPWIGMFALLLFVAELRARPRAPRARGRDVGLDDAAGGGARPAGGRQRRDDRADRDRGRPRGPRATSPPPSPRGRRPASGSPRTTASRSATAARRCRRSSGSSWSSCWRSSASRGRCAGGCSSTWRSASPGVVALAYVARASATWSDFKAITVTAPFILTLGFVGAAAVGMWRRTIGIALGGLVVIGVLAGNFLFIHGTSFAPYDRLHDLQQIADKLRRPGPVAVPRVRGVQRVPPARHGGLEPRRTRRTSTRAGTRRRCRACSSSATWTSTSSTTSTR